MSGRNLGNVSYLDALRPDPGWSTDFAVLATYSADLVAVVAALLALAGADDDRGSGSKVDFANAVERLRNKVRVLVQAGRIIAPRNTPKILAILDQYVREVGFDEAQQAWHPKAALVRHRVDDGDGVKWRLWIGSRNLTRDQSWDTGLALEGHPGSGGRLVPGVDRLAYALIGRADLPEMSPRRAQQELSGIHWIMPGGCIVEEVELRSDADRRLPQAPEGLQRLTVVSPFLDGRIISELGRWGDSRTTRRLVSTLPELTKLAAQKSEPLSGFGEHFCLAAPIPDDEAAHCATTDTSSASDDEEPDERGLHAKIIAAEHAGGATVWVGSANATQRGWNGPNAEIVAKLSVEKRVISGLEAFVAGIATTVSRDDLRADAPTAEVDRLELARKEVAAAWRVHQEIVDGVPTLIAEIRPHPSDSTIELSVGLLGNSLCIWPRSEPRVSLPRVADAEVTELVHCALRLADQKVEWLQRAPLVPPPSEERDRKALAKYLDPRTFLAWIRRLLTGDPAGDGGDDWDDSGSNHRRDARSGDGPIWWAPTIEEVLKAWVRDPKTVDDADRKVRQYLKLIEEENHDDLSERDRKAIEKFRRTWEVIRAELVGKDR